MRGSREPGDGRPSDCQPGGPKHLPPQKLQAKGRETAFPPGSLPRAGYRDLRGKPAAVTTFLSEWLDPGMRVHGLLSRHRNRTEPRVRPDSPMGACTHTPPPEAQPQGQESVLRFTSGSVERHIQPRFPFLLTRVQTLRQGPRSVQPQGQEHDRAPAGMPALRQTYRPLSSLHRPVHVCIVRHAGNTLREDVTLQPVPSRRQRHCDEPLPRSGGSRLA